MGKGPLRMLGAYTDPRADLLCYTAANGTRAALPLSQRRTLRSAALSRMFCAAEVSLEAPEQLAVDPVSYPLLDCPEDLSDCSSVADGPAGGSRQWDELWFGEKVSLDAFGQGKPPSIGCFLGRAALAAHWQKATPAARAAMLPRLLTKARQMQAEAAANDWSKRPYILINPAPKVGVCRPVISGGWATNVALDELEDVRARTERMARRMAKEREAAGGTPLDPGQVLFRSCH
jgi:hypothetical protein